jgi:hypothetical protein
MPEEPKQSETKSEEYKRFEELARKAFNTPKEEVRRDRPESEKQKPKD